MLLSSLAVAVIAIAAAGQTTPPPTTTVPTAPTTTAPGATSAAPGTTVPATTTTVAPLTTFEGSGIDVVDLGPVAAHDEALVVDITHDGLRNFVVWEVNQAFEDTDLMINVIGPYDGRRLMNLGDDADTGYLRVEADGSWTFKVYPLTALDRWTEGELHDVGDNVVVFVGEPGVFSFAHTGESNFVIWIIGGEGRDLAVNEIGPIEGSSVISDSPAAVIIESEGEWWLRR